MKYIILISSVVLLFGSAPANADPSLKDAHAICLAKRNVLTGAKPITGFAAGFEKCADIMTEWDKSEAARQQKYDVDKSVIDSVKLTK